MDATLIDPHAPTVHQSDAASTQVAPIVPADVDRPYLFTAEQFVQMVESEVFTREDRVELWDGKVYEKMAKVRPHNIASALFIEALGGIKPSGWSLNAEESVSLNSRRVTLPDIVLIRGGPRDYSDQNPPGRDVGLLVELSYSTLKGDKGRKLEGYAKAGVLQYWIANLVHGELLVHRDPVPDESRHATAEIYRHGDFVSLFLDGVDIGRIAVSDLLP